MSEIQTVLVSGANQGIGLEVVRLLSSKLPETATIFLGTRFIMNGNTALESLGLTKQNVKVLQLDVTDASSIAAAIARIKLESPTSTLDVLINNAGVAKGDPQTVFGVNVVAVRNMLNAFASGGVLSKNARLVVVASEVGSAAAAALGTDVRETVANTKDLTAAKIDGVIRDWLLFAQSEQASVGDGRFPSVAKTYGAYGMSKALVLAETRKFGLDHLDLKVTCVCPGYCATALNGFGGYRSPADGAQSVVWPLFNECETGGLYQDGKIETFEGEFLAKTAVEHSARSKQ
ncbi:hypothetical protein HDU83_008492 [Entophlyctis luteolus]|nr:hypothetical protein HDU83_008492 [Entophlyctis luteolus]